jgi:hypothetical protein
MKSSSLRPMALALALACSSVSAWAADLIVSGVGDAPIGADSALTRDASLQAAKRDAVIAAVKRINGPAAINDPKVMVAVDALVRQIGDEYISDVSTRRDAANHFVTTLKLKLDDKAFRKLVSDEGVAVKTGNSYPILMVMDEYFTVPTDHAKPLREVVDYFSDKSAHNKVDSADRQSSSSSSDEYAHSRASVRASDYYGSARASGTRSYAASSAQSASSSSSLHVDEGQNDIQSFHKVVEYQPQHVGPSNRSYTYEAILREAASYDLNVLDNSVFRSRYFTGKPLTLQELMNGPELARYVTAARNDAHADYFLAGTTIIYDLGTDASTGLSTCDGVVSLKAFSTADSKVLTADARSESASGRSPDQCRVNVANKLAAFTSSVVGSQIGEYWKNRNMYGQQYSVQMVSLLGRLNFQTKNRFRQSLEQLRGVKDAPVQRQNDSRQVEYSLQYSGDKPIADAIGELISTNPGFSAYPSFDVITKGNIVRICLESSCPANL